MTQWLYGHEEKDRERGILSPADREFLLTGGENLSSEQSRRNTRRRIRNRIRNAIIDFDLIVRLLSDEDKQLVFEEEGEWQPAFMSGQKAMIEFLYSALADTGEPIDFETVLKSGVHDGELERHDGPVFVNVDFDVKTDVQFDIQSARERFEKGETLTIAEIGALLATGAVDEDELNQLSELAQEKGVVESSISPMQAEYSERKTGESFDGDGSIDLPTDAADTDMLKRFFIRGESLMLLDAYTDFTGNTALDPPPGEEDSAGDEGEDESRDEGAAEQTADSN